MRLSNTNRRAALCCAVCAFLLPIPEAAAACTGKEFDRPVPESLSPYTYSAAPETGRLHFGKDTIPSLTPPDSAAQAPLPLSRYERNRAKRIEGWARLIPNQGTLQYAGSIGVMSIGLGWNYGRGKHWETDLMIGFVPRYHSEGIHTTFTVKERYVPWHCRISHRWAIDPLTAGIFFSTISGDDFWRNQPDRYPKNYYGFPTKLRSHVCIGQRVRFNIPRRHRIIHQAISAYYELSTCDLYIVSKAINRHYPWSETLSLAFGLCFEM